MESLQHHNRAKIPLDHDVHAMIGHLFIPVHSHLEDIPSYPTQWKGDLNGFGPLWQPTSSLLWVSATMRLEGLTMREADRDADILYNFGGKEAPWERYMNSNALLARLVGMQGAESTHAAMSNRLCAGGL